MTRPEGRRPSPPEREPTRRERAKADKRARLRAAAEALFRERGFEATTIRDVAARADLGVGTVYAYVADKHALLEWMSEADLAVVEEEAFATLPKKKGIEAELLHVFRRIYAHHARDPELARVIVKELSFARDATAPSREARFRTFFGHLAALVEVAQSRGEIEPSLVPIDVAAHVFGLHFYVLVLWLKGSIPSPEAPFERALALAMRGLRGSAKTDRDEDDRGAIAAPPSRTKRRKP